MSVHLSRVRRAAAVLLLSSAFAMAADAPAGSVNHTFRYVPPAGAATVPMSIAADFNGWSAVPNPMVRGSDGSYSVTIAVPPGLHHYKVVYDGKWIADPAGDKSLEEDDGFQGKNSGFKAVAGADDKAAAPAAGQATHTFAFTPPPGSSTVAMSIAGDFNGWSAVPNPMVRGADGVYRVTIAMAPGRHHYKVVNDGKWIADPAGDKSLEEADGFEGMNSGFDAVAPAQAPAAGTVSHTFRYVPPAGAATVPVSIAGDFNGWSAVPNVMTRGAHGAYSVTVFVAPGLHHYKLVLDGKWIADPGGDKSLEFDDGFQGKNSGFNAGPVAPAPGAVPSPLVQPPADGDRIAVPSDVTPHTFRYTPPAGSPTVPASIAGDFNGWSAAPHPMVRGEDGTYAVTIALTEGLHHYKVVYDGKWIADPAGDKSLEADDGFQGMNSGVIAGMEADQFPAPTPGAIDTAAVVFDPASAHDLDVISPTAARVALRCRADDVTDATIVTDTGRTPMALINTHAGMNLYSAVLPPAPFVFELSKPGAKAYIADGRVFKTMPADRYHPPAMPTFVTPDWAKSAVWYQILPERFRNGDVANDPPHTVAWTSKWFDVQPGENGGFYQIIWDRRYGGDLQGIREKLPYLRKLGITAIYLNPVFQAPSLHKYNTTDYRHVDEHFGFAGDIEQLQGETEDPATWQWTASDKLFLDLIAEAHRQGFKVIIDGVYNHTGTQFWAFQDVLKNGQNSKYAGWYDIIDWNPGTDKGGNPIPFHWRAWDGENGEAPAFKKDPDLGIVHGPREHIMAVAKRWLAPDGDPSRGVDGFRLDAPENIPHPFWVDFRNMVKAIKPDALIDGEIWPWAQPWLDGKQFDGVTNYQFAVPAQQFFVNRDTAIPPSSFDAACDRMVFNYPFQTALVNMNLIDSHDTDRAASMFVNPDLPFNDASRIQDNHPNYSPRKPNATETQRMMQEVTFQMTFVGAPMVYYGDEAGMWGAGDPSGRQPMTWDDLKFDDPDVVFDADKFAQYQRLIAVRQKLPALQTGFYRKLLADDAAGTFAFARDLGDQHAYVVLNRSDKPATITVTGVSGDGVIDWLNSANVDITTSTDRPQAISRPGATVLTVTKGSVTVQLPAYGSAVLAPSMP